MPKNNAGEGNGEKILIARFSALGDVAMTVPVVYSVCRSYPGKQFCMLTTRFAATMFINPPENLTVKGVDTKQYDGVGGLRRLAQEVYEDFRPDVFVDLHGVLRSYILAFFLGLRGVKVSTIDKGRKGKRALTRKKNKKMFPLISSRERYREVFFRQGLICGNLFESLFDGKAPESNFTEIISPKSAGQMWIAIAPFAKHRGKVYPLDLMERVIAGLAEQPDCKIFLLGAGAEEQAVCQEWCERYPACISLAGKHYGFLKELSLLSWCDAMVSMDSANMHLASLVRLPVVSIWGATHPYCGFMGWRQEEANAVQLNMACRPCSVFGNKPCLTGDYFCMRGIPPELIVDKVFKLINERSENE